MSDSISPKDVKHVAKLARIEITESEESQFSKELSSVLGYIDQLQEVDTQDVEPTYHPVMLNGHDVLDNITRPDTVIPSDKREEILNEAPAREGDFVKVKSVFK